MDASTASKMMAIENVVDKYYLEEVDKEALENGIYAGMVASLGDPYSTYYSVEELQEMEKATSTMAFIVELGADFR